MSTSVNGTSTSASAASTPTTVSGVTRYLGLASGLDVDSIVKGMMTADQQKIDTQLQKQQQLEWKQSAYQSITTELQNFQNAYLSLTGGTSMLSANNLTSFTGTSTNSVLNVSGNAGVQTGNHVVNIYQSAVTSKTTCSSVASNITVNIDTRTLGAADLQGTSFSIKVDGVSKAISFTSSDDYSDIGALVNNKLKAAYGTDLSGNAKVSASTDSDGFLSITENGGYKASVTVTSGSDSDALVKLGITSGASNRVDTSSTLAGLFGSQITGTDTDGNFTVNINGTDITLNTAKSLSQNLAAINAGNVGVTASYDSLTDKISLTATQGGAAGQINLNDNSTGFFDSILGAQSGRTSTAGRDAIISLDGIKITRDSNAFTVSGMNMTINSVVEPSGSPQTSNVVISSNTDSSVTLINNFVDSYNKLITDLNNTTLQKPDPNYKPLTDAQKANMSDDAVTKWQEKAKQGILFNDSTVTGILTQMRQLLNKPVVTSSGKTMYLNDIGITLGDYTESGQLHVDKSKLTAALQQNPNDVLQLFTKTSSVYYSSTGSNQTTRRNEEGLSYRLQDVLKNAVGLNGSLMKLAGMPNDPITQKNNSITTQLTKISTTLKDLQTQFSSDQTKYYNQFVQLETFMSKMNAQSSYVTNMFNTSG